MCYQIIEVYAECRCTYYEHSVDKCPKYPNHDITKRIILVGYGACSHHSTPDAPEVDAASAHNPEAPFKRQIRHTLDTGSGHATGPSQSRSGARTRASGSLRSRRKSPRDSLDTRQVPGADVGPSIRPTPTVDNGLRTQDGHSKTVSRGREREMTRDWRPPAIDRNLLPQKNNRASTTRTIRDLHKAVEGKINLNSGNSGPVEEIEPSTEQRVMPGAGTIAPTKLSTALVFVTEKAFHAAFSKRLNQFEDLEHLWPQLLHCCTDASIGIQTIERLLGQYSEDLKKAACSRSINDQKSLTRAIDALLTPGYQLKNIARSIWEAHNVACEEGLGGETGGRSSKSDSNMESTGGNEYDPKRGIDISPVAFENLLFGTEPILALQTSVKAFVSSASRNPSKASFPVNAFRSLELGFQKLASIYEPALLPGKRRVRWICVSTRSEQSLIRSRGAFFMQL